ncbi:SLATT domain-containing protein [Stenotrophomonas maltophilia]|nr:SLATT domain-containing protein [Stenotrophomonas maltophilia]
MTDVDEALVGQIRECYGRVVYTHKTHEKCADLLFKQHQRIKKAQIFLSALVTCGVISTIFPETGAEWAILTAIVSTALFALNAYTKDYDLGEVAQKHRQSAADVWIVREQYLTLLTDLESNAISGDQARERRDELLLELGKIYSGAPSTNAKAYLLAQKALQRMEEMTFSDEEIDKFLPRELRRTPPASTDAPKL